MTSDASAAPVIIRMHERDNVAIVANDGGLPAGTVLPGGLVLTERVPQFADRPDLGGVTA